MGRIFCFGCSFTMYDWPTWADILIDNHDGEGYNYGKPGLSNENIARMITIADCMYNYTEDDKIYVLWTHWWRHNFLTRDKRIGGIGSVFGNGDFDRRYIKKYVNPNDIEWTNMSAIISVNKLFNITHNHHIVAPRAAEGDWEPCDLIQHGWVFDKFQKYFPPIDYVIDYTEEKDSYVIDGKIPDPHPSVEWHLNYAKSITPLTQNIQQKYTHYHNYVNEIKEDFIFHSHRNSNYKFNHPYVEPII